MNQIGKIERQAGEDVRSNVRNDVGTEFEIDVMVRISALCGASVVRFEFVGVNR